MIFDIDIDCPRGYTPIAYRRVKTGEYYISTSMAQEWTEQAESSCFYFILRQDKPTLPCGQWYVVCHIHKITPHCWEFTTKKYQAAVKHMERCDRPNDFIITKLTEESP